ncbi:MAG: hypothetical protein GWP07_00775 [Xanthomonadaceae bacterium]|nr:hypothetical protein [Xanthomonadaceae bacterium]
MRYPKERKESILKKMMPPNNQIIADLAKAESISDGTLYKMKSSWENIVERKGFIQNR